MGNQQLTNLLFKHEGLRLKPYFDIVGKLTIAVGRNLDDVGISESEALFLLCNDIESITSHLKTIPAFNTLNTNQKIALSNMTFNLGFHGILRFKKMWAALEANNYQLAAKEMLNSKWAEQAPLRAKELSNLIREA
jgi:lysozyme